MHGQGVMFWRWDAVNTVNLGEGDNALTIGLNSNTFQVRALYHSWYRLVISTHGFNRVLADNLGRNGKLTIPCTFTPVCC